jgi:hypothetical protein
MKDMPGNRGEGAGVGGDSIGMYNVDGAVPGIVCEKDGDPSSESVILSLVERRGSPNNLLDDESDMFVC